MALVLSTHSTSHLILQSQIKALPRRSLRVVEGLQWSTGRMSNGTPLPPLHHPPATDKARNPKACVYSLGLEKEMVPALGELVSTLVCGWGAHLVPCALLKRPIPLFSGLCSEPIEHKGACGY